MLGEREALPALSGRTTASAEDVRRGEFVRENLIEGGACEQGNQGWLVSGWPSLLADPALFSLLIAQPL